MKNKIFVISSGSDWRSLEEIYPTIERQWLALRRLGYKVEVVRVQGPGELIRHASSLLEADWIVLTNLGSFDSRGVLRFLRQYLAVNAPLCVHLHGEASSSSLALEVFHDVSKERDILLLSCEAERKSLRLAFRGLRAVVIPFALPLPRPPRKAQLRNRADEMLASLVYAGRISVQKNLHTLLVSLWILRKLSPEVGKSISLRFFGGADRYGSPRMEEEGIDPSRYPKFLIHLTEQLDLGSHVRWEGELQRSKLAKAYLFKPHVFVSPSLYTSENFGASAFASLSLGAQAVLSDWGGHRDFARYFRGQALPVPVQCSSTGPHLSPVDFAKTLLRVLSKGVTRNPDDIARSLKFYDTQSVSRRLDGLLRDSLKNTLRAGNFSETVLRKKILRRKFIDFPGEYGKVFQSYRDRFAQPFFLAYGMRKPRSPRPSKYLLLLPWVSVDKNRISIQDPHRGSFSFRVAARGTVVEAVIPGASNVVRLSAQDARRLIGGGMAYAISSREFRALKPE